MAPSVVLHLDFFLLLLCAALAAKGGLFPLAVCLSPLLSVVLTYLKNPEMPDHFFENKPFSHNADDTFFFSLTPPLPHRSVLDSVQTHAPSSPGHPEDRPGKWYQRGHSHLPAVPRQTRAGGESVHVHHGHQQQPLGGGALLPTYVDTEDRHTDSVEEMKLLVALVFLQQGEKLHSLCIQFFAVKCAD